MADSCRMANDGLLPQNNENDSSSSSCLFVERICKPQHSPNSLAKPDRISVLVSRVQPKHCSSLAKQVSRRAHRNAEEKAALAHLRRVRRTAVEKENKAAHQDDSSSPSVPSKKRRTDEDGEDITKHDATVRLDVLLMLAPDGSDKNKDEKFDWLNSMECEFDLCIETRLVPGRSASSKKELEEFNRIWPTIYFHEQSEEHIRQQLKLSSAEITAMQRGMECAIQDAKTDCVSGVAAGAVVVNPETGAIVARASAELREHGDKGYHRINTTNKQLCTPVLLAIQRVSRIERAMAMGHGMDSDAFKSGQYLCTGYDLYTTIEPDVFEAMACVHSRLRRVVFGVENKHSGGLGGTGDATAVHALPGTNHHYRAFGCQPNSLLWKACREIHSN